MFTHATLERVVLRGTKIKRRGDPQPRFPLGHSSIERWAILHLFIHARSRDARPRRAIVACLGSAAGDERCIGK